MIAALFQQFRKQYPTGHLTTELLQLQEGLYVVRATLADGKAPIVTAMSASTDLDAAEMQAQRKALALLGLTNPGQVDAPQVQTQLEPPLQDSVSPSTPQHSPTPSATAHPPISATAAANPPAERPATETASSEISTTSESLPGAAEAHLPASAPDERDLGSSESEAEVLEAPDEEGRPIHDIPELPNPELANPAVTAAFAPDLSAFDSASTDLSDVIAQTDVEMRRLGWSSQQGREHLEQTYNKRSRQQLTDEELLEFLLYLEAQSVPVG